MISNTDVARKRAELAVRLRRGTSGTVESINTSDGGAPKHSVPQAQVTASGVEGDRQEDLRSHGGPDRAVLIYSLDLINALREEGHPISPGSAGENLTISGLDWSLVVPGAEVRIGSVHLQVTRYASPCYKITASFRSGDAARISQKLHPGWSRAYTRVLAGGLVRAGDAVELSPCPSNPSV